MLEKFRQFLVVLFSAVLFVMVVCAIYLSVTG